MHGRKNIKLQEYKADYFTNKLYFRPTVYNLKIQHT